MGTLGCFLAAVALGFGFHLRQSHQWRRETDSRLAQIDKRLDYIVKVQQRHYGERYQYRVETPATDTKWN